MAIRRTQEDDLNEGTAVTGGQSFEEMAESMPKSGFGFGVENPPTMLSDTDTGEGTEAAGFEPSPAEIKKLRIKMTRKMKQAMDKMKKSIATYPKMYFSNKAKKHPEWTLDADEEELITDSITFALDILDIDFEIEALHITLKSIWWVIMYPVSVIGLTFFAHQAAVKETHPEDFKKEE
jgi:hypothetical protein